MNAIFPGSSEVNRRDFLRRAAIAGALAVPAGSVLAGCATSGGGDDEGGATQGAVSEDNPLGVDPKLPLDVYIFKGGFGDDYAKFDEEIYKKRYPDAEITHTGQQQLAQKLQPRFVQGNPPDVIDNSGDGNLDAASLVSQGQLQELGELYAAPSWDFEGKTVEETLLPGVIEFGEFDGKPFILNYVYTAWGLWYSKKLFTEKGWEYPTTWDGMLAVCEQIKAAGMAPWTFQGKYPRYVIDPIQQMAVKAGGLEVAVAIDNLEPNAWKHEAVKDAATAMHELVVKGYILEGTAGLSHTESQTQWAQGKAAFIPCGTWLENELGDITPTDFEMTMAPVPSLTGSDKLPFEAVEASAGEPFIVPSKGKNVFGGMEFIRIMLSKEASTEFSNLTKALTVTSGYADDLSLSTAFDSARDVVKNAGDNAFYWKWSDWYTKMKKAVEDATGALMAGQSDIDTWANACQKAADDTAADPSITKYTR